MSLFLSREIGSIETGPQTFAKEGVQNTSFIFTKAPSILLDPPGLLNSTSISNAGLNSINGIYVYVTEFEGKPYYVNEFDSNKFIIWFENNWEIYNFSVGSFPIYFSNENVLYPWAVTNWSTSNSVYNPLPIVTKVG
jgi:hypothetical protein